MKDNIELRLLEQAQRIATMYKTSMKFEEYQELCNVINRCYEYAENGKGNWGDLYEVILGEEGIWGYAYDNQLSEELKEMWSLETCILSCNCYIGCEKEQDCMPQDLEIKGECIAQFIEFMEHNFYKKTDYKKCFDFWSKNMCY